MKGVGMPKASGSASRKIVVKKTEPLVEEEVTEDEFEGGAYIPDPRVGERYKSRQVHGKLWDVEVLEHALDNGINVLLMGDTGAGKTMLGEAFASKAEMQYYSLPCDVSIDPTALFGKIVPTEDGEFEWVDGPVTQLVRYGGVLNISEINFMPPRIAAALYPLLDSRRYLPLLGHKGEVIRAHRPFGCWCDLDEDECASRWLLIIADMNPQYRGTQDLNAAFKNRFGIKIPWGYDKKVEGDLILSPSLLEMAQKLRAKVGTEIRTPVATNMLMEFERFVSALGMDFAASNFLAAFEAAERDAVKNVFDVHKGNIKADYDRMNAKSAHQRMHEAAESASDDESIEISEDEFDFEVEGLS